MGLQLLADDSYWHTSEADPVKFYRHPLVGRLYAGRVTRCLSLLPTGRRVLEVGYGCGVSFLNLAEKFDEVHGIDLHDHPDEVARSFAATGLKPRLRQGTITDLPYEDESFDAALAISIHEHIAPDEQARAFSEVHRVLRPGGCYVVGVPGGNAMMTVGFLALGWDVRKSHVSTDRQVLQTLRQRFDVDTVRYSPFFFPKSMTTYVTMRGYKLDQGSHTHPERPDVPHL